MSLKSPVELLDLEPAPQNMLTEVLMGLSRGQKTLSPKYLYDKKGSEIFEKICELPEYYPTKAENEILKNNSSSIAEMIGDDALLIEPGSGSGEKIRYLLRALDSTAGYVPIEISREILVRMTVELLDEFPSLNILPVCADFTHELDFPLSVDGQSGRKVIFFPGSTIGNFSPDEAMGLLKKFSKILGHDGGLLIGVDLKKDKDFFKAAYDDSTGVTAAFNLNLLERLNREVDASFNLNSFTHKAFYNEELGRVEMHLRSKLAQLVRVNNTVFRFREGETIHTENSYKYSVAEFTELCAKAKLRIEKHWIDSKNLFCVYYFVKE